MPKGNKQRFKFTYLMKILEEKTDDENGITMPEIIAELEKYGITAERKGIYAELKDMEDELKLDISREQEGNKTYYHLASRHFELAEIKLLIDAVQSSRFITEKKSRELIKKIKELVSKKQAKQLERQVFVQGRIKTKNETIYYSVDDIHRAIGENRQIRFLYTRWNVQKKLEYSNNGAPTVVSPWALTWNDGNYYLIAYDNNVGKIKHYRVDKMQKMEVLEAKREGKELYSKMNLTDYYKSMFGMYSGETKNVTVRINNVLAGVFIDRFGENINFQSVDSTHSNVHINVMVSRQFFGWIFGLDNKARVVAPEEVVREMEEYTEEFLRRMKE